MIEEVLAADKHGSFVRIPPGQDVPITARVSRIIDTPSMRRLGRLSQLGVVALVYPGATHTRLEHSLGVYHNAIGLLRRFSDLPIKDAQADAFVLAALLHDCGHWPFCHPIEDMRLSNLDRHEHRVAGLLQGPTGEHVR